MSCHESPLKQTELLEKKRWKGGRVVECLCRGHKHLVWGGGGWGGGREVRGLDV